MLCMSSVQKLNILIRLKGHYQCQKLSGIPQSYLSFEYLIRANRAKYVHKPRLRTNMHFHFILIQLTFFFSMHYFLLIWELWQWVLRS